MILSRPYCMRKLRAGRAIATGFTSDSYGRVYGKIITARFGQPTKILYPASEAETTEYLAKLADVAESRAKAE